MTEFDDAHRRFVRLTGECDQALARCNAAREAADAVNAAAREAAAAGTRQTEAFAAAVDEYQRLGRLQDAALAEMAAAREAGR